MTVKGVTISPVNMKNRQEVAVAVGDTVRVLQKVEEKGKTRLQPFEGLVLARKHGNEAGATFTVRRTGDPYGTEKIFPLYSPRIDKIEIIKRANVRRSKLYHIREKAAKEIKRQMRNLRFVDIATESDMEEKARAEAESQKAEGEAQEKEEMQEQDTEITEKTQESDTEEQKEEASGEVTSENKEDEKVEEAEKK